MKLVLWLVTIFVSLSGCLPSKENPKYLFSSGSYKVHLAKQNRKAYLEIGEGRIKAFEWDRGKFDTTRYSWIALTDTNMGVPRRYNFIKYSFDLDVISIPLKFRPALSNFPAQLNTTVNGGVFIGRRADIYRLSHRRNELGRYSSSLQHFGFSLGLFTGIGSAVMNPSVTENGILTEYDALVVPVGLNASVGVNNVTFGAALGIDQMLSRDRNLWIYRNRPWVGLTLGLNLN